MHQIGIEAVVLVNLFLEVLVEAGVQLDAYFASKAFVVSLLSKAVQLVSDVRKAEDAEDKDEDKDEDDKQYGALGDSLRYARSHG